MNLYSAFSIDIFKCALQASDLWVRSDISIPVYTRLLLHKLIFVRLSRTTKPPAVSMDTAQYKKAVYSATDNQCYLYPEGHVLENSLLG